MPGPAPTPVAPLPVELTKEQIQGLATPEPMSVVAKAFERQGVGFFDALKSISGSVFTGKGRSVDMLDEGPARDGKFFTVMRTEPNGTQYLERKHDPFQQSGPIISADAERVTQSIRGRETFTYKTSDLLYSANDRCRKRDRRSRRMRRYDCPRYARRYRC
jgi:hypothetical protein